MTYKFRYRRRFFFHSITVVGHIFEPAQNKMMLYMADGGIREIPHWTDCRVRLGADWVAAAKKLMEAQAGQAIPIMR